MQQVVGVSPLLKLIHRKISRRIITTILMDTKHNIKVPQEAPRNIIVRVQMAKTRPEVPSIDIAGGRIDCYNTKNFIHLRKSESNTLVINK
jgi:hypothetical protein